MKIKLLLKKFRFFFRRKLTLNDFTNEQQFFIMNLCEQAALKFSYVVFERSFNNILIGKGFEFVGIYPVFYCKELGCAYFSESNEID